MHKLIIQDIAKINNYWYAIYFSGTSSVYAEMSAYLRQQQKENAYWDSNALDGKGAWIMRLDLLRRLFGHFANAERAIVIADRRAALAKIGRLTRKERRKVF